MLEEGRCACLNLIRRPLELAEGEPGVLGYVGIAVGRRRAFGIGDAHQIVTGLLNRHLRKIAGYIGQQIGLRIANLIEHLLRHCADIDHAACAVRLGIGSTESPLTPICRVGKWQQRFAP